MNSEFPMSFIEEQPTHTKSKSKSKSNVVALSRPQESMLNGVSHSVAGTEQNQSPNDYALSQFDDSASSGMHQSTSRARLFVRGTLLTVLAGLWVAIGTGHLHSQTPAIVKLREALPSQLVPMSNESAEQTLNSENMQSLGSPSELSKEVTDAMSVASMPVAESAGAATQPIETTTSVAPVKSSDSQATSSSDTTSSIGQPTNASSTTASAVVTTSTAQTQAQAKNPVSPIPEEQGNVSMSESYIRKMFKMLRQQQQQLMDLQEHMSSLIAGTDNNSVLEQELRQLEEQHLQAAKMLKDRRAKLRQ